MNVFHTMDDFDPSALGMCLLNADTAGRFYQGQAEDILTDDDLLELFRIVRKILCKKPDAERISKLLFCVCYALGENVKFSKAIHDNRILFIDQQNQQNATMGVVQLPNTTSCCSLGQTTGSNPATTTNNLGGNAPYVENDRHLASQRWFNPIHGQPDSPLSRLLSTANLTEQHPIPDTTNTNNMLQTSGDDLSMDSLDVRPFAAFQSIYPTTMSGALSVTRELGEMNSMRTSHASTPLGVTQARQHTASKVLQEPNQRGFYYHDGRIAREPELLQRYAEQGVLTQAAITHKRKSKAPNLQLPSELAPFSSVAKKPKIPHRHGEFQERRNDIISRMRSITLSDLEQRARRLPASFTLAIEKVLLPSEADGSQTTKEAAAILEPALRVLIGYANMKPHQDNGMNQNGIYYNTDYYKLFQAFEQFQTIFDITFAQEVNKNCATTGNQGSHGPGERDKDRERKIYRKWIEPHLTETNWAAFRRNIVVGERITQLATIVGPGILLMTKELSGSKLHLTFTNSEWDEFIHGLSSGKWDSTITWDSEPSIAADKSTHDSLLVYELQQKFARRHWFSPDGDLLPPQTRKQSLRAQHESNSLSRGGTTTTSSTDLQVDEAHPVHISGNTSNGDET